MLLPLDGEAGLRRAHLTQAFTLFTFLQVWNRIYVKPRETEQGLSNSVLIGSRIWNFSHLENPPAGPRAMLMSWVLITLSTARQFSGRWFSKSSYRASTHPPWPTALLDSLPNSLQLISTLRKISNLPSSSHMFIKYFIIITKGQALPGFSTEDKQQESHWQYAKVYSKYHTIALFSSLVRNEDKVMSALKVWQHRRERKMVKLHR